MPYVFFYKEDTKDFLTICKSFDQFTEEDYTRPCAPPLHWFPIDEPQGPCRCGACNCADGSLEVLNDGTHPDHVIPDAKALYDA